MDTDDLQFPANIPKIYFLSFFFFWLQEGSRELEAELEMQLEQAESRLKEQRSMANRLQMENDQIRDKLEQCQREYHCQVSMQIGSMSA